MLRERVDPENTRGGEITGEPYVQPSLFMHILKSLMPGRIEGRLLIARAGLDSSTDSCVFPCSSIFVGAFGRYVDAR